MLRKIFIIAAVVGIPLAGWMMFQYAQLPPVDFHTAMHQGENKAEAEQTKKFLVRGKFVSEVEHNHEGHSDSEGKEFMMSDETGKVFKVSYTGKEKIDGLLQSGKTLSIVGHVHGTPQDAYFHASQALEKY
ncbi:MAG: hypothetical protein V4642_16420 [Bacteroidota bacterium]